MRAEEKEHEEEEEEDDDALSVVQQNWLNQHTETTLSRCLQRGDQWELDYACEMSLLIKRQFDALVTASTRESIRVEEIALPKLARLNTQECPVVDLTVTCMFTRAQPSEIAPVPEIAKGLCDSLLNALRTIRDGTTRNPCSVYGLPLLPSLDEEYAFVIYNAMVGHCVHLLETDKTMTYLEFYMRPVAPTAHNNDERINRIE